MQHILLVALIIGFVTVGFSQHRNYNIKNGFALGGGITQFDITTDNFKTKKGDGWMAYMSATVDIPHRWYNMSYGMQLSENKIGISGRVSNTNLAEEILDYKLFTAQVALLAHIKPFQDHFTIDVGPMLQYNGKLELENDEQELYLVNGYDNLTADDISSISQFNINGAIGATLGFGPLKLKAQYIYGFTNMLNKLNDADIDTSGSSKSKFKGNQSMMAFTAMFTF